VKALVWFIVWMIMLTGVFPKCIPLVAQLLDSRKRAILLCTLVPAWVVWIFVLGVELYYKNGFEESLGVAFVAAIASGFIVLQAHKRHEERSSKYPTLR
jgi:hypothetical protein